MNVPPVKTRHIPAGPEGIADTATAIIALSHDPATTSELREIALMICQNAGARTDFERVKALFAWMRDHVDYVRDPLYREFVQPPLFLINAGRNKSHMAAGDCDDHACCLMSLVSSLGIPTRIALVEDGTRPGKGSQRNWAHVYCEALVKKTPTSGKKFWVPIDSSLFFLNFGEKVHGWTTHIYPGDIPIDILHEASRRHRGGLGFVESVVSHSRNFIYRAMTGRTKHSKGGLIGGVETALGYVDEGLGYVFNVISAGSGIATSIIQGKTAQEVAKAQMKAEQLKAASQAKVAVTLAELAHESSQLDKERQYMLKSESEAFNRARRAAMQDKLLAVGLTFVPLGVATFFAYKRYRGD